MSAPKLARGAEVYVSERFNGGHRLRLARVEETAKRGVRVIMLDSRSTIKRWVLWKDIELTPPVPAERLPGRVDIPRVNKVLPGLPTPDRFIDVFPRREPDPEPPPVAVEPPPPAPPSPDYTEEAAKLDIEPPTPTKEEPVDPAEKKQPRRQFSTNERKIVKRLFDEGRTDDEIAAEVARTRPGTDADAISRVRSRWGYVHFRKVPSNVRALPRPPAPPPPEPKIDFTPKSQAGAGAGVLVKVGDLETRVPQETARAILELLAGV